MQWLPLGMNTMTDICFALGADGAGIDKLSKENLSSIQETLLLIIKREQTG